MNSGKESEIVADFCAWLAVHGWHVRTEVDWIDVLAEHGGHRIVAEAKGKTAAPGLDVDTLYGQLLRRMTAAANTTYAVVVPEDLAPVAARVDHAVRARLNIVIYGVDRDGTVRQH
jgi:hypothetical protein